ncbi:MAG: intradiol ring-cleavage dioxygenase [Phycisphaerae bacterium]|nr:protocatechuate 3,4-dioxygenase [Tepidisphaeraceae bacterium]
MNAWSHSRRRFLARFAAVGATAATAHWFFTPGAFAAELARTPAQTEGPFYPDKLPLDTDNDLLVVNEQITPGVGEVTHFSGRVLGLDGQAVRSATVEIWQCDAQGVYLHTRDMARKQRDTNFQGFGRCVTGPNGEYYFRTIKPVPYPGRTPHIHVMVKVKGKEVLTTQAYVKGHAGNERDGIWKGIKEGKARDSVTVDFTPVKESKIGELAARFDIVLGATPKDG